MATSTRALLLTVREQMAEVRKVRLLEPSTQGTHTVGPTLWVPQGCHGGLQVEESRLLIAHRVLQKFCKVVRKLDEVLLKEIPTSSRNSKVNSQYISS